MSYPPQQPGPYGPQQGYPQSGPMPAQPAPGQPAPGQPVPGQPMPGQQQWGAPQGQPQQPGYPPPGQVPPGQVPPGGQVPPQGQFGPPPPAPQKKSSAGKIISGIAGVFVLGLVLLFIRLGAGAVGSSAPEAGECLNITDASMSSPDWESEPCGSAKSDFVVAKSLSGSESCGDEYSSVSQTRRRGSGYTLCLVPDVKVGDCMKTPLAVGIEEKVACGEPGATEEVTGVASSPAGESECTGDYDVYATFTEPAPGRTICMKQL
ncbi:LppU/SCO3897 family protein [Saccharopolyspora taberi]|uniref:Uncharacterized protein n=1 Tax=Saccharopolyspora taberi TaxID=60895 RepID=A0ABN3VMT3_9PSEU